jgi:transcriptional regulator with XRE-family HTH domain
MRHPQAVTEEGALTIVNAIRHARSSRGWTSAKLNAELRRIAHETGVSTASQASLRVMISCWENDRQVPDATYQLLLQKVFDLPPAALGFQTDEPGSNGLAGLVQRGAERLAVSDDVLGYFRRELVEQARLDNIAGPGLLLNVVSMQVEQLRAFAERGPRDAIELASRFLEHAGWLHQDSGSLDKALSYSDEAVDLAERAGNGSLTAYHMMRKSNVLTARGDRQRASVTAQRAATLAAREAPEHEAVCLRQVALSEAYLRNEAAARGALERALELAGGPTDPRNLISSYCTPSYVEMEGALCLLVLGSPAAAAEACSRALRTWPGGFARDEAMCLMRLALAQLDLNQVDEACATALVAITRVQQAPSARSLHMLRSVSRRVQPFREARSVREFRDALALVA